MQTDYKVLYRKYRPSNFDEVVGQKYTINMLKNAIINNKLAHAYIFTGPRGTGKTSTAKIFAKTINCENPKNGLPCEKCSSCLNINNSADIIEIDAASNNGVDEIRELINNIKIAPTNSKYKVYIIDEVHMMTQSAFNALLLTLEEPPKHIIFILATTNIENVPITILSRCQRYDFKKISDEDIINQIKNVATKEKINITDEAIKEIMYLSDGGLRDALSILNQLSTSNDKIDLDTVLLNYGTVSIVQINNIIDAFINNDYDKIKSIFDDLKSSSLDYKNFVKKIIDNLFEQSIKFKINHDEDSYKKIKNVIFDLNELMNKININVDPFMLIFMTFLNYMNLNNENNKTDNKQIENKEEYHTIEKEETKEKKKNINLEIPGDLTNARLNNCFALANKQELNESQKLWNEYITNVSLPNKFKSLLIDSYVVLASQDIEIVVNSQKSIVDTFNSLLLEIEKNYASIMNKKIKFIALTESDWEKEKQEYISKIRSGYKYTICDEPNLEEKEKIEIDKNEKNDIIEEDAFNIFDKDKVEVK